MGKIIIDPFVIEKRSFEIIEEETLQRKGDIPFDLAQWSIVRRLIHTTADFDILDNILFHPHFIPSALRAIRKGCPIVTDTKMASMGISERRLSAFGNKVYCFVSDEQVGRRAEEMGCTRSMVAVDMAVEMLGDRALFAIGNAPTAIYRLLELMEQGKVTPPVIIGLVVGFVGAAEAKEEIIARSPVPYLVLKGRKGGSTLVAATLNALLDMAAKR